MPKQFDYLRSLGPIPVSHRDKLRFYQEANRTILRSIRVGVLFVMAFWSGPARLAFADLKKALSAVDPGGSMELVVVDADGCPDLYESDAMSSHFPGCGLSGAGETAWIFDGVIVATSRYGEQPGEVERHTSQLLDRVTSRA